MQLAIYETNRWGAGEKPYTSRDPNKLLGVRAIAD